MEKFLGHHGDVGIWQVDALPADAKEIKSLVLHKGEGTNEHRFTPGSDVAIYETPAGLRFFTVGENSASLVHEEHKVQIFTPAIYRTIIERKRNPYTQAIEKVLD